MIQVTQAIHAIYLSIGYTVFTQYTVHNWCLQHLKTLAFPGGLGSFCRDGDVSPLYLEILVDM